MPADPFKACDLCGSRDFRPRAAEDGSYICGDCRSAVKAFEQKLATEDAIAREELSRGS